ncbi:MAG: hypothetical protein OHK0045_14100 [Raineya sp.]
MKASDSLKRILESATKKDSLYLIHLIELSWSLRNSDLNEAFRYSREALYLAKELKQEPLLAKIYNQRGVLFRNISDYPQAEQKFYDALRIAQKYGNLQEEAYAYNNIGDLQRLTGNIKEGIRSIEKAQNIFVKIQDKKGEAYTYIRLSEAYQKLKDYEKAYIFAEKSLEIRKKLNHKQDIGASLNRVGDVLTVQEKYEEALRYYQQAVSLAISSGDATGKVSSLQDIAKVYTRTQKYQQAKQILDECLEIAKKNKNKEQESNIYEFYTELYEKQDSTKQAYEYYKKRQAIKDSVFSNQRMLQISQMRVRYDLESKEKENELLKNNLSKERTLRILGLAFSIIVLFSGIWIYRNSKKIERFNQELYKKNEEISSTLESLEQANQAISIKNKEIEQRSQEIEIKNTDLIQSIGYSLLIQEAMLPSEEVMQTLLSDYFVIWEPRDIISGDFYWVADKPDKLIVVLADCTGHGVPGALMSMLGSNLLNNIVHDKEVHQPHIILEMMDKEIISILHKEHTTLNDAMEMAILVIEKNANFLHYAGAGIPLYYISDGTIQTIAPNKTSIGNASSTKQHFTFHTIIKSPKTKFYLSTDGYKDQFGGEHNKKFGSKQFKKVLEEIADKTMQEQKEILTRRLYLWQKASQESQTDDITVLGFRI